MIMKNTLLGLVLGALLTAASWTAYDTYRSVTVSAPASTTVHDKPLLGFSPDPSWLRSGTPNFRNAEISRSPDGRSIGGVWACDGPSTFEWTFFMDETVYLLEGLVEIDYQGQRFTLRPGQTATFHAGTKALWHVPVPVKRA